MATEIRRTYTGSHPTKKARWGPNPGGPLQCYSQVLVVLGEDGVALSMNGTAVLTYGELEQLVRDIQRESR